MYWWVISLIFIMCMLECLLADTIHHLDKWHGKLAKLLSACAGLQPLLRSNTIFVRCLSQTTTTFAPSSLPLSACWRPGDSLHRRALSTTQSRYNWLHATDCNLPGILCTSSSSPVESTPASFALLFPLNRCYFSPSKGSVRSLSLLSETHGTRERQDYLADQSNSAQVDSVITSHHCSKEWFMRHADSIVQVGKLKAI